MKSIADDLLIKTDKFIIKIPKAEKNILMPDAIIMTGIIIFFVALMILISHFGNPATDESFPFAIALRFINGQKPFIDDFSPYMSLAFLLYPLIKLSLYLHQGTNELILFLRHSFVVFTSIMGIYVFFSTNKYLPSPLAFFSAITATVFHPFQLNNFHYDTLALIIWTGIIFQFVNFLFQKNNPLHNYFLFSCLNLMLCFAYPTFILLLAILYSICFPFLQSKSKFFGFHFFLAFIASISMFWLLFGYYGVRYSDLMNTIHFWEKYRQLCPDPQGLLFKVTFVLHRIILNYKIYIILCLCIIGIAHYYRRIVWLVPIFLSFALIFPLFEINIQHSSYAEAFYFYNCMGFLGAVIFLFFLRKDSRSKKLFYFIWVPAFFAGLLTNVTTANYTYDYYFSIGFFPASIVGIIFAYMCIEKELGQGLTKTITFIASRLVLIYGFLILAFFQTNYIYGENTFGLNIYTTTKKYTQNGPFNGLYLDANWYDIFNTMQRDLEQIDTNQNKFVYFGIVSAGYLLPSKLQPGEYLLYSPYQMSHFKQKVRMPNYTFDFSNALSLPPKDFQLYLPAKHTKIFSNPYYEVYYSSG